MDRMYLASKVNVYNPEYSALQKSLDEFYNSPEHYFKQDDLSMDFNSPKFAYDLFSDRKPPKKDIISYSLSKNLHQSQLQQIKNRKILITLPKEDSQRKQVLTEMEVHDLYTSISLRQTNNQINESKARSPVDKTGNVLKLKQRQIKRNERVLNEIALKSNKQKDQLLMNNTNDFRVKQEARMYLNKYLTKKNYWIDILRQPSISSLQKIDNKKFFINNGTLLNPKWEITTLDAITENRIDPTNKEENLDKSTLGFNFIDHHSIEHRDLTKVIDKCVQLKTMTIEGKSLVNVEYNNFKNLKGNKFIRYQMPREQYDEIVFHQSKQSNDSLNNSLIRSGKIIIQTNNNISSRVRK